MKLVICTKFQVNRMNCVESRRGGGRSDCPPPPLKASFNYFSSRLLGLINFEHSLLKQSMVTITYKSLGLNKGFCLRTCRKVEEINSLGLFWMIYFFVGAARGSLYVNLCSNSASESKYERGRRFDNPINLNIKK